MMNLTKHCWILELSARKLFSIIRANTKKLTKAKEIPSRSISRDNYFCDTSHHVHDNFNQALPIHLPRPKNDINMLPGSFSSLSRTEQAFSYTKAARRNWSQRSWASHLTLRPNDPSTSTWFWMGLTDITRRRQQSFKIMSRSSVIIRPTTATQIWHF